MRPGTSQYVSKSTPLLNVKRGRRVSLELWGPLQGLQIYDLISKHGSQKSVKIVSCIVLRSITGFNLTIMSDSSIFFSYSRKDSEFVLELSQKLKELGADIWLDQTDIEAGSNWDDSVEEALANADTLIVVLSERSVVSKNVRDEYSYAIEENKQVVPVLMENCTIPFRLRRLQYADFTTSETVGIQTLVDTLKLKQPTEKIESVKSSPGNSSKPIKTKIETRQPLGSGRITKLGIGLIALLVLLWLGAKYLSGVDEAPAQVTVLVHGENGKDELVLPNRGVVKLLIGEDIREETINSKGEATFKQIPAQYFDKGQSAEILFTDPAGEPYRSLFADSAFVLEKGKYIAIPVKLEGLESVHGIVKHFETGEPIEGVRVSISGVESFSNQYGEYELSIPKDKQQQFQTVRAQKEGFELFELQNIPIQTNQELPIALKPRQ